MNHHNLISVIVPLWRPWEATEKLWESLNQQTVPFELITVEGRYGPQKARNVGSQKARGTFLFFCDQDVVLSPCCLQCMRQTLFANPDAGYVYCDYQRKGAMEGIHKARPFDPKQLQRQNFIDTCSLLRASAFSEFDESIGRLQDWDLWLTLLRRGVRGTYIPLALYTKWYREEDISLNDDYAYWFRVVQQKHHRLRGEEDRASSAVHSQYVLHTTSFLPEQ